LLLPDVSVAQLVLIVALAAVSAVAGGVAGYGTGAYTLLNGRGAALVIGSTLIATVPLRRIFK